MPFPVAFTFPPHGKTCEYFGVVAHMRRGDGLSCKVGEPITELIVTRRDEAALFAVQGVADREGHPTAVAMGWKVRWIDVISQEEGVSLFLRP